MSDNRQIYDLGSPSMRKSGVRLAMPLIFGLATAAHAAEIIEPSNLPITQTVVTLLAGVDTVLGSNRSRRYLCLMNTGTGLANLGFDQTAVPGLGWALEGTTATGHQGGSMCWENAVVAGSSVHAISDSGTTVIVLEGR
jgi:hypothetical protein